MKIRNKINQLNQMKKRDNLLPAKYTLKWMTGKGLLKTIQTERIAVMN